MFVELTKDGGVNAGKFKLEFANDHLPVVVEALSRAFGRNTQNGTVVYLSQEDVAAFTSELEQMHDQYDSSPYYAEETRLIREVYAVFVTSNLASPLF